MRSEGGRSPTPNHQTIVSTSSHAQTEYNPDQCHRRLTRVPNYRSAADQRRQIRSALQILAIVSCPCPRGASLPPCPVRRAAAIRTQQQLPLPSTPTLIRRILPTTPAAAAISRCPLPRSVVVVLPDRPQMVAGLALFVLSYRALEWTLPCSVGGGRGRGHNGPQEGKGGRLADGRQNIHVAQLLSEGLLPYYRTEECVSLHASRRMCEVACHTLCTHLTRLQPCNDMNHGSLMRSTSAVLLLN